jgi:prophage antirepressor-like protein
MSMTNLELVFQDEHKVRVVFDELGNPWWVAKDVCDVLGHSNSRMALEALADDEKGVRTVYTPGGPQEMQVINESGLYTLILRSRKAKAKEFRKWVTGEVLPEIRQHGTFMTEEVRALMKRVDEDRLAIGKMGQAIELLLEKHEEDRRFWVARDTATTERLNRMTERQDQQERDLEGVRHPQPIGRAGGRKILDRILALAWQHVNIDPANQGLAREARKPLAMAERRSIEDDLRRKVEYPRDTGNAWSQLPSDRSGSVQQHLNTLETEADRKTAKAAKAEAKAQSKQKGLFDEPDKKAEAEEKQPAEERAEDKPN